MYQMKRFEGLKKVLRDPQNVIAIAVSLISVCALMVSVYQTRIMSEQRSLMHEQAKASVWPRISLEVSKGHRESDYAVVDYSLILSNEGVGPAIVTDVRVWYDDKIMTNWWDVFEEFEMEDTVKTFIGYASINKSIYSAADEDKVMSLSDNLPLAQYFYKNYKNIKIEIIYESIYGDKWKYTKDKEGKTTIEVPKDFKFSHKEQFEN